MPADLAEAVRSLACGACQAPRGEYCPCDGTHLARWELAAAAALVSERDYCGRRGGPACPGRDSRGACPWCPNCPAWYARPVIRCGGRRASQPQQWVHLDPVATPSCPAPAVPGPAPGEPCRYQRRHWLLGIPAVAIAGTVPACARCARKHARRARRH